MIIRAVVLLLLSGGLAACGSDTSTLQTSDSTPLTLPELDDVVITVAPEDLSAEPIVLGGSIPDDAEVIPVSELVDAADDDGADGVDGSDDSVDDGLNLLGGDDPEDERMPDVVCMGLQDAQDEIQDRGVFLSRSEDATGEGRRQLWDRNWIVVAQSPGAGEPIGEGDAVLSVVKEGEPNDC